MSNDTPDRLILSSIQFDIRIGININKYLYLVLKKSDVLSLK